MSRREISKRENVVFRINVAILVLYCLPCPAVLNTAQFFVVKMYAASAFIWTLASGGWGASIMSRRGDWQ